MTQPQGIPCDRKSDGGSQTQNTGSTINPDNSPPDVHARCVQGQQHCLILAKQDRVPLSPANSTGNNCTAHHFMDGPHRLFNQQGNIYHFSKWDEKQQKTFTSQVPKPMSQRLFAIDAQNSMHMPRHVESVCTTVSIFVP